MHHWVKVFLTAAALTAALAAILCACSKVPDSETESTCPETEPAGAESSMESDTESEPASADRETATEAETMPTVPDDVIGIANVANAGYAMAGSCLNSDGYSNLNANDGDPSTKFSSQSFTKVANDIYLFVDLTRTYTIRSVVLLPAVGEENLFPVDFELQVSDNGQTWSSVLSLSGVSDVGADGITVDMGGVEASFVRLLVHTLPEDNGKFRFSLGEMQVLADVRRTDNLVLFQNDIWLYMDTSATLQTSYRRIGNASGDASLRFFTDDPAVAAVDAATGLVTPVGFGDTTVYVYDGENLASCHVRVLDDTQTEFRISTFYHSSFGYPDVIPACLDYMKDAGIGYLEETRTYDAVGNQVCDYMMYLCAQRGIFYSVCDPLNSGSLAKATESQIIELVQKYENRAGFGGIYLTDEPHEESNDYARVARIISDYNHHVTPHLNLLPIGGFPSWDEYVSEYCAITGGAYRMRYLSYDNYCFMAGGGFNWSVFNSLNKIRQYGLKYNASTGYYMQCMEITGAYRISSDEELLFNASMGLAYGMKNFKWFVYLTPIGSGEAFTTGMIAADFTPSSMYAGVQAANARIAEWGKVLGKSDAVEVYHSDSVTGNEVVPDDFVIRQTSGHAAICSLYRSTEGDGRQYVVIVNRDYGKGQDKEFTFTAATDLSSLELYDSGMWTDLDIADGSFTLFIPAGDSVILRLPDGYDARRGTDGEPSENLALGCAAFVSSSQYSFWTESDIASYHLTDGNTSSGGWRAGNRDSSPTILIDLGEVRQVSRVDLYALTSSVRQFPDSVAIEVSADGTSWTQVFSSDISADDAGRASCTFGKSDARYVRITSGRSRCTVGEVEIYK